MFLKDPGQNKVCKVQYSVEGGIWGGSPLIVEFHCERGAIGACRRPTKSGWISQNPGRQHPAELWHPLRVLVGPHKWPTSTEGSEAVLSQPRKACVFVCMLLAGFVWGDEESANR